MVEKPRVLRRALPDLGGYPKDPVMVLPIVAAVTLMVAIRQPA